MKYNDTSREYYKLIPKFMTPIKKKFFKIVNKLIRGNWYVFQHQMDKVESIKRRYNKGKKASDKISQSEIIRFAIDNMPPYEKK